MSNKTSNWYKLWRLYRSIVFIGIFLSLIAACGTTGQETRNNEIEVPPARCDHCAGLQVTTNKQSYTQTEPITVTARLILLTKAHVTFAHRGTTIQSFKIDLVDEKGLSLTLTDKGLEEKYRSSFQMLDTLTLEHPFEETFRINPWFNLSGSGVYTLTIEKRVWVDDKAIDLVSNPVVFRLLP